jgi:hypothetical protein
VSLCVSTLNTLKGPEPLFDDVTAKIRPTQRQQHIQYGYEHSLEQVNLAEQLTFGDFGISTGLIKQNYWANSKWFYVNVERGKDAD